MVMLALAFNLILRTNRRVEIWFTLSLSFRLLFCVIVILFVKLLQKSVCWLLDTFQNSPKCFHGSSSLHAIGDGNIWLLKLLPKFLNIDKGRKQVLSCWLLSMQQCCKQYLLVCLLKCKSSSHFLPCAHAANPIHLKPRKYQTWNSRN